MASIPKVMRTILLGMSILSLAALLLTGCGRHHARAHVVHPRGARVVVIEKGHKHSVSCGHYRHDNKWYHAKGHHHKKGCGHHKVNGVWIVRR